MKNIAKLLLAAIVAVGVLTTTVKAEAKERPPTIVGIALAVNAETGEFSTLIAALDYVGLVDALNAKKQFTVFAPTDAAFAKLNLDAESIVKLPKEAVADILLYHVAPGSRPSQAVAGSKQIRMLNGDFTKITAGPKINDAAIVATDFKASNGVIHVIDTVLLPPQ